RVGAFGSALPDRIEQCSPAHRYCLPGGLFTGAKIAQVPGGRGWVNFSWVCIAPGLCFSTGYWCRVLSTKCQPSLCRRLESAATSGGPGRVFGRLGTVLSTLPTISTTILGLMIGELLRSSSPARTKIKVIGMVGLSGLAVGWALSFFVPVVMKMWTTSYGIL